MIVCFLWDILFVLYDLSGYFLDLVLSVSLVLFVGFLGIMLYFRYFGFLCLFRLFFILFFNILGKCGFLWLLDEVGGFLFFI